MADERLDVEVKVDLTDLEKAKTLATQLEKKFAKGFKLKIEADLSGIEKAETAVKELSETISKQHKLKIQADDGEVKTVKELIEEIRANSSKGAKFRINVEDSALTKSKKDTTELTTTLNKGGTYKIKVDDSQLKTATISAKTLQQAMKNNGLGDISSLNNTIAKSNALVGTFEKISSVSGGLSQSLNIISASLQNLGNNMEMVGRAGLIVTGALGAVTAATLVKATKSGIGNALDLEAATSQIKAQGITGEKLSEVMKDIREYAEISPFDTKNMTEAVSAINSYAGNIDMAKEATKIFGTSLMASGKSAEDLANVAKNLGQLYSGAFVKTDYNELLRGVPAISQALRDAGVNSWEEFNIALGDNPDTKGFERTSNALIYLMDVLDKYNVKTNAMYEANNNLKAQWSNFVETTQNKMGDLVQSSGLYAKLPTMIDNLGKAFDKNQKYLEKFYSWLGDIGVRLTEKLADFDFDGFGKGIVNGFNNIRDKAEELYTKYSGTIDKIKNKLTDGEEGAKGLGNALVNVFSGSAQLYAGGIVVKAFSSLISMLSTTLGLVKLVSDALGKLQATKATKALAEIEKINQASTDPSTGIGLLNTGKVKYNESTASKVRQATAVSLVKGTVRKQVTVPQMNEVEGFAFIPAGYEDSIVKESKKTESKLTSLFSKLNPFKNVSKSVEETIATEAKTNQSKIGSLFSKINPFGETSANIINGFTTGATNVVSKSKEKLTAVASGMKSMGSTIAGGAKSFASGVTKVASSLAGLGQNVLLITLAVKSFENLPDGATVTAGFLKVGAVMAGMSLINIGTSKVASFAGVNQTLGAVANLFNAGTLFALTAAIKTMKDLPSAGEIASGFAKISAVVVGMSALNMGVGAISMTLGFLPTLANVIGGLTNILNAGTLASLTSAVKSMKDLPSDTEISEGFDKLGKTIASIATLNTSVGQSTGFWSSLVNRFKAWNESKIVKHIAEASKSIGEIAKVKIPDGIDAVGGQIEKLTNVMSEISNSFTGEFGGMLEGWLKKSESKSLSKMAEYLSDVAKDLAEIGKIKIPANTKEKVLKIISDVRDISAEINSAFGDIDNELAKSSSYTGNGASFAPVTGAKNTKTPEARMQQLEQTTQMITVLSESAKALEALKGIKLPKTDTINEIVAKFKEFAKITFVDEDFDAKNLDKTVSLAENIGKIVKALTDAATQFDAINSFKKIDTDKITSLTQAIKKVMNMSVLEGDIDTSTSKAEVAEQVSSVVSAITNSANELNKLNDIKVPDKAMIDTVKTSIKNALDAVKSLLDVEGDKPVSNAKSAQIESLNSTMSELQGITEALGKVSTALTTIQNAGIETERLGQQVNATIGGMKHVINLIHKTFAGISTDSGTIDSPLGVLDDENRLTTRSIDELTGINQLIEKSQGIVSQLGTLASTLTNIQNAGLETEKLADQVNATIVGMTDSINKVYKAFSGTMYGEDETIMAPQISITNSNDHVQANSDTELSGLTSLLTLSTEMVAKMGELSKALTEVQNSVIDATAVGEKTSAMIEGFKAVINQLHSAFKGMKVDDVVISGTADESTISVSGTQDLMGIGKIIEQIDSVVNKTAELGASLDRINVAQETAERIKSSMSELKSSLQSLGEFITSMEFTQIGETLNGSGTSSNLGGGLIPDLSGTGGKSDFITRTVQAVVRVTNQLSSLQESLRKIQEAKVVADQVSEAMKQLIASLENIVTSMSAGGTEGTGLAGIGTQIENMNATGITKGINGFIEQIKTAIESISTLADSTRVKGLELATAFVQGFASGDFKPMPDKIKEAFKDMRTIGEDAGKNLKNGFDAGVANLSAKAIAEIEKIKTALNSIPKTITINATVNSNVSQVANQLANLQAMASRGVQTRMTQLAKGGVVQAVARFATGGHVGLTPFKTGSTGTDKIPALLTNGEYVQNRNAVNYWGRGLMDALNNRNVARVQQLMENRLGATNQTIVNNNTNYNNHTATVNQSFNGGASSEYMKLNRLVRGV